MAFNEVANVSFQPLIRSYGNENLVQAEKIFIFATGIVHSFQAIDFGQSVSVL